MSLFSFQAITCTGTDNENQLQKIKQANIKTQLAMINCLDTNMTNNYDIFTKTVHTVLLPRETITFNTTKPNVNVTNQHVIKLRDVHCLQTSRLEASRSWRS